MGLQRDLRSTTAPLEIVSFRTLRRFRVNKLTVPRGAAEMELLDTGSGSLSNVAAGESAVVRDENRSR